MRIQAATDIGCRYDENQDCCCAGKINDSTGWLVVCDGMGGMSDGEEASRQVCRSMAESLDKAMSEYFSDAEAEDVLMDSIEKANNVIASENKSRAGMGMMGTTVVCAIVRGNKVTIGHCGDSRAYHISKKGIEQLTKDHSVVQEMVDSGRLTPEQAAVHPNKNVITRALGVEGCALPDFVSLQVQKGDMLLLCTDGLSNMLEDSRMLKTCRETAFYDCPSELVKQALEAGGIDNITALMMVV